jgi:hypothetical protein
LLPYGVRPVHLGLLVRKEFEVQMEQQDRKELLGWRVQRAHRVPREQVVPMVKTVKMAQVPIKWL